MKFKYLMRFLILPLAVIVSMSAAAQQPSILCSGDEVQMRHALLNLTIAVTLLMSTSAQQLSVQMSSNEVQAPHVILG